MTDGGLDAYGWSDRWRALFADAAAEFEARDGRAELVPARVVRHDGVALLLTTPEGLVQRPVLPSVEPPPVSGDWVVATADAVVGVLPRAGLLRREDPAGGEQAIAANIDAVFVVCGLDRPVKAGRIQRSAALAWDAGAVPVVVLTKADLRDDADAVVEEVEATTPGVDAHLVSNRDGRGLDELRAYANGKTILLLGESGAGKSTLANALVGDDIAATGAVRSGDSKGRHTTTARQLHPLPTGGVLVDTPGIRAVGLWIDPDAVTASFEDIEELALSCRFADCAHDTEPDCAVRAAVEDGTLAPARLDAWVALEREAASAARRADARAQHAYERRFGRLVRDASKRKRPG